ncbi:uncharacterized protein PGTG_02010 [Puccinia graminis f. sp. tritici CRL 75-36-700-3]|uniref:DUF4219 domain-containing protein n=1 Tax=Puccinia graminis f. sp. tritici (strain CRL 75-36-700-3 / race SCCL) TaxID=418459 RepID=E3JWX4_PUCGT|nr:uncharacterized protein PGTG_02010 [Puccinia graminis f. sp. tritici CRL 75-36-700-3]EFP76549.1 hypothetical protein PGTG_02010 [Puccinia graminis f. sp. tritici CRL 75-36-700-3]
MEKINSTILKTALKAIPLLTANNYTLWQNCIDDMLDLQGLWDSLTSEKDSSIHPNIINHDNKKDAQKIWSSISDFFASTQPTNCARVFNELLDLSFNSNNVQPFITLVRTINSQLFKIGIDLPHNLVTYILLKKLCPSLKNISQKITHSDKPLTSNLVLDHLKLFNNNQAAIAARNTGSKTEVVALYSNFSKKCKIMAHNFLSNHPGSSCWMLYPHLRPANGVKANQSESTKKDQ